MSDTPTPENLNPTEAAAALEKMTVKDLRELASTKFPQIKGIASMNKAPLIAAITEAMTGGAAPAAKPAAKAAPKGAPKATKKAAPEKGKTPVRLPAFSAEGCSATTPAGQTKAEIKFLREFKKTAGDKAAKNAARKQMKRLKKRTRHKDKAE